MKRLSRDAWLAIALGLMIVAVLILAGMQQTSGLPPYTSLSSSPSGTRALRLWLEENGYTTGDEMPDPSFRIPSEAGLALVLEPTLSFSDEDWDAVDEWVSAGGVFILAGQEYPTLFGLSHFDFRRHYFGEAVEKITLQAPLLIQPPVTTPVTANTETYLASSRTDYVVHLASEEYPIMVSFPHGEGTVILGTAPYLFSNRGLKDQGNPELIRNLVAHTDGMIWFDEWHHGIRTSGEQLVGPGDWLFGSWAGRAVLYIGVMVFIVLMLQGQRFGRALTLANERTRRAPLEYINAIANLSRRAGHRHFVLSQYYRRLRTALGQRYRLHPGLSDDDFVKALEAYNPPIDLNALRTLLHRLHNPKVSEAEMVDLAARAALLLEERPTSRRSISETS